MTFEPGEHLLFMKVGTHAQEDLTSIIARKRSEIAEAGFTLWGYGGNTCHPTTMVQPFARSAKQTIKLYMEPMVSNHLAEPLRAEEYSVDGKEWAAVPSAVNAFGSRYGLWIDSLEEIDETLDLASTKVAVGNSTGKSGESYVKGRVDKACLEVVEAATTTAIKPVHIGLVANVAAPWAVFLRS